MKNIRNGSLPVRPKPRATRDFLVLLHQCREIAGKLRSLGPLIFLVRSLTRALMLILPAPLE
jgi:hypothetical protein